MTCPSPPPPSTRCPCECGPTIKDCPSCGGCGSCGQHDACTPPRRLLSCRVKVRISPSDKGVVLPQGCLCSDSGSADLEELWLWVRKRGQSHWLVKYPAWDLDDYGDPFFLLDHRFFDLPFARYEGEIRYECETCEVIELDYRRACVGNGARPILLRADPAVYPTETPVGVTPMFQDIYTFSGSLCGVLDKGVQQLPLCPDTKAALCALPPLCRPVQLVISDGARSEIVEFSGCLLGEILVERGAAETAQRRFPPGSEIKFAWTPDNVTRASMGCP